MMIRTLFIASFLLIAACSEEPEQQSEPREGRTLTYTTTVDFLKSSGDVVSTIDAAVADDDASRSEGLMDVRDLPADAGMLFIFDDEEPRSFWMANTPISLDIIFVDSDMEIVRIHRNTPPYSHENVLSEVPAKYTVEVNAGYTMRHDITEGMQIRIGEE